MSQSHKCSWVYIPCPPNTGIENSAGILVLPAEAIVEGGKLLPFN